MKEEDSFTLLERSVIEQLLCGDDPMLKALREQFHESKASMRELTGAGFFTKIHVPANMQAVPQRSFKLGDVEAEIDGLEHGAGFLLYIEKGQLHMLEGYSYDEAWPSVIRSFKVSFTPGPDRDMPSLRKIWS